MDQSRAFTKLLRVLRSRKHLKELTSTCKRINKDRYYESITAKPPKTLSTSKKPAKFELWHSKKRRNKNSSQLLTQIQEKMECLTVNSCERPLDTKNNYEHLSSATPTSPANLSMVISQSYKPLHAKSTQLNKNTIAVTKGTVVKALYSVSNWVFIENSENGETGFVPIYCVRFPESSKPPYESPSYNNISLLNVSVYDKPRYSRVSISNNRSHSFQTPQPGCFVSSIGPCRLNNETLLTTYPRSMRTATFTRSKSKDESLLSREISNISLHAQDQDAYDTLNLTPRKNLSLSMIDKEPVIFRPKNRVRITENYQRRFVGDISVLESEVVTLVNPDESPIGDWRLVKRGDGQQGYIPEHIVTYDENLT